VPRNANVRFAFSKRDFAPFATEVVADEPKVVRVSLLAQSKGGRRGAKANPAAKKSRQAPAEMKDDTIPVEF
jgi:hypothetical protein